MDAVQGTFGLGLAFRLTGLVENLGVVSVVGLMVYVGAFASSRANLLTAHRRDLSTSRARVRDRCGNDGQLGVQSRGVTDLSDTWRFVGIIGDLLAVRDAYSLGRAA